MDKKHSAPDYLFRTRLFLQFQGPWIKESDVVCILTRFPGNVVTLELSDIGGMVGHGLDGKVISKTLLPRWFRPKESYENIVYCWESKLLGVAAHMYPCRLLVNTDGHIMVFKHYNSPLDSHAGVLESVVVSGTKKFIYNAQVV